MKDNQSSDSHNPVSSGSAGQNELQWSYDAQTGAMTADFSGLSKSERDLIFETFDTDKFSTDTVMRPDGRTFVMAGVKPGDINAIKQTAADKLGAHRSTQPSAASRGGRSYSPSVS